MRFPRRDVPAKGTAPKPGAIARVGGDPSEPPTSAPPPPPPRPRSSDPRETAARAIERLRRLWTLARGDGPEAAAARAIAERFERSSGIALRIVPTSPVPNVFPPPPILRIVGAGGLALLEWEGLLIEGIANLFGVLVVRELDAIALVGERQRVEDAAAAIATMLRELAQAYQRRCPDEHRGLDGVVRLVRWNGQPVVIDVQGWYWEFAIAWAYGVQIELLKRFSRPVERPVDLTLKRAEAAIGDRKVTSDETSTRLPVVQSDARAAGTVEGQVMTLGMRDTLARLERYHGPAA